MKDCRDTFASQLLSAGVQLSYVSSQLGHADFGVTVRHYASWVGGDQYRAALTLEEGEVPADLLARLAESPQTPPSELGSVESPSDIGREDASDSEEFADPGPGQREVKGSWRKPPGG